MMNNSSACGELSAIFAEAAVENVFPGGVVFLARGERVLAHEAFGTTAYDAPISRAVTTDTLYDIASVTKLFTATAFFIAAREMNVAIESPVAHFLPQFRAGGLRDITLRQLLNHSHGLELHLQELPGVPREEWIDRIAAAGLRTSPGETVRYMCTAFFLLTKVIESWTHGPLDEWVSERILQPLQLARTTYRPLNDFAPDEIAPTEVDAATGEPLRGAVHDEASRAWNGISGNAGLFSVAADLGKFAQMWLQNGSWNGRQIIDERDVRRALTDVRQEEKYKQGLGWHQEVPSWMSNEAPPGTAGHLGFTGPSLFISPATQHICIILDNRVYPTREGPLRLKYHRQIAEWLFRNS
ncbi:MAG TPA: serine hydrolase domain-containing protein [Abditibacteriaceae bacterium]|jgi:CubicO group peptidase (beta-lactamase class C family)